VGRGGSKRLTERSTRREREERKREVFYIIFLIKNESGCCLVRLLLQETPFCSPQLPSIHGRIAVLC
jgi:hypothetical protein